MNRAGRKSVVALLATLVAFGCRPTANEDPAANANSNPSSRTVSVGPAFGLETQSDVPLPNVRFTDVTESAGIRFRHTNGAFGRRLLPETMGSGAAFLDYDNDGHQDLLLVNACYWPGFQPDGRQPPTQSLYRNNGDGRFEDVTAAAGLNVTMYGMGVTCGDYDNDGWVDIFISGVGGNRLFQNTDGEGGARRFVDRTETAGVRGDGPFTDAQGDAFLAFDAPIGFPSSTTFVDYDGDGRLDLFVCNYIRWSPKFDLSQSFRFASLDRSYGPPTAFEGVHCALFRNLGEGRFEDVSDAAGVKVLGLLDRPVGKSLGVVVFDPNQDGWPDIMVANDTVGNFLFQNSGKGTFREVGKLAGVAYAEGQARGAMGVDWGEYRPGVSALLVGNFADEPNTFLRLDDPKGLLFSDVAAIEGVAGPSRLLLKFGAVFLDYDLDSRQDLLTCNGHLEPEIHKVQASQRYKQPAQLFWNCGPARKSCFIPVTSELAGDALFTPAVGRACAYADIDADGDLDLVFTENGGEARLLRNEGGTGHHWIRIALRGDGRRSNASGIGATIVVESGKTIQRRELAAARGYLSQSELVATFGLGTRTRVDRVVIRWPGPEGGEQVLTELDVDRLHTVTQAAAPAEGASGAK
ncbi:MAG: CRTAC1 family protein [Planctomycetes bacterium]|nr:CRTAC1 family protein [Planctomycetota bacterium]